MKLLTDTRLYMTSLGFECHAHASAYQVWGNLYVSDYQVLFHFFLDEPSEFKISTHYTNPTTYIFDSRHALKDLDEISTFVTDFLEKSKIHHTINLFGSP
jgi:hypothetical protein